MKKAITTLLLLTAAFWALASCSGSFIDPGTLGVAGGGLGGGGGSGGGSDNKTLTVTITGIPGTITGEVMVGMTLQSTLDGGQEAKRGTIANQTVSVIFDLSGYTEQAPKESYFSFAKNERSEMLYSKQKYSRSAGKITIPYSEMVEERNHPDNK